MLMTWRRWRQREYNGEEKDKMSWERSRRRRGGGEMMRKGNVRREGEEEDEGDKTVMMRKEIVMYG